MSREEFKQVLKDLEGKDMTVKTMKEYLSCFEEGRPFYTVVLNDGEKKAYNVVDVGLLDPGELSSPVLFLVVDGIREAKEEGEIGA